MRYDPVKKVIGDMVRSRPILRVALYKLLGLVFLREWHVKRELRRLLGSGGETRAVYDAGCGFGQYSYYMAKRFRNISVHAVDVKQEEVEDCRTFFATKKLSTCSFAVEDLTRIDHKSRFDLVLSVDVMEHIQDDITVFRNFLAALKPGGMLLVNTPSNLGGSDAHAPDDKGFIEEHARVGYGIDEIRTKLQSVGFQVEKIKFTYGRFGEIAWRLEIKIPMMILGLSRVLLLFLPMYYIIIWPIVLPLKLLDYVLDNKKGTGLIVLARKPKEQG